MAMVRSAPRRLYPASALALPLAAIRHWLPFSFALLKAARPERFACGKAALSALMHQAMPAWVRRVEAIGAADLLRQDGHFLVWESAESARGGLVRWTQTDTGTARFRVATDDELKQLAQVTTTPIHGAIRFENTGQIADPARLLERLESVFVARGGTVRIAQVARLTQTGGVAAVELEGGERLTAATIVVSAGVRSKGLLEPLGVKVPMVAERGYHIQSSAHMWPSRLPPVVFEDRSMIVTGFEGGLRAASFVEFAGVDDPADPGKWRRLRGHVRDLGLPFGSVEDAAQWFGARPTLPDYLPAIGRMQQLPNLYYAFGHQHLGLTLGPVTGEIVAEMVVGGDGSTELSLAPFSLERFL